MGCFKKKKKKNFKEFPLRATHKEQLLDSLFMFTHELALASCCSNSCSNPAPVFSQLAIQEV